MTLRKPNNLWMGPRVWLPAPLGHPHQRPAWITILNLMFEASVPQLYLSETLMISKSSCYVPRQNTSQKYIVKLDWCSWVLKKFKYKNVCLSSKVLRDQTSAFELATQIPTQPHEISCDTNINWWNGKKLTCQPTNMWSAAAPNHSENPKYRGPHLSSAAPAFELGREIPTRW